MWGKLKLKVKKSALGRAPDKFSEKEMPWKSRDPSGPLKMWLLICL